MKVNIYDPENISKGRMMLLNIAEDLKDDCKMVVSPQKSEVEANKKESESKPYKPDEVARAVEK